jgi:hypothetical protein
MVGRILVELYLMRDWLRRAEAQTHDKATKERVS